MGKYSRYRAGKLYMIRSSDPEGIDEELDRRTAEANRRLYGGCRRGWQMADTQTEENRWYIDDDGVIHHVEP